MARESVSRVSSLVSPVLDGFRGDGSVVQPFHSPMSAEPPAMLKVEPGVDPWLIHVVMPEESGGPSSRYDRVLVVLREIAAHGSYFLCRILRKLCSASNEA